NINLNAMFRGARAAIPHFIKKRSGNIVTTASTFGLLASPDYPGYCATKAAIVNLTREMALDYGPYGIRVNCICPGAIETPRFRGFPPKATLGDGMTDEQREKMGSSNKALLRMGRPEEIAHGDRVGQISGRPIQHGELAQIRADFKLDRVDAGFSMTPVGLHYIATGILFFFV